VPIEVIFADHQNKADVAGAKAREWFDTQQVDMIGDVAASATALAALEVAKTKNRIIMFSGPATNRLTNENCTSVSVHYTYDTYALAAGTGRGVLTTGGDTWFFITADYAFGHSLEKDVSDVVRAGGGKILGSVRHPLNAQDFSSFLLQAQNSKAKIIGLANAGGDTINAIKAAHEFGIAKGGQKLAGLLVFITDIHALGLETAQGLNLTTAYYWDRDDQTRAFAKRFAPKVKDHMPTMVQGGVYASVLHYLKARQALGAGNASGAAIVAKMRELPSQDPIFGSGTIRADGRHVHKMYLYEVKAPAESKGPWDYYKLVREIPAEEAFLPLDKSVCPLVKK